jgi:3'-5' exoribonuclease
MKSQFISSLAEGQVVSSLFLVREKEVRTSARSGKSWLELGLADRSGTIPAKMWENFEAPAKAFECDDVVRVGGRVKIYNGQKELALDEIHLAADGDYDIADFLPHTKEDVEKLYASVRSAIAGMKNPWLRQLLRSVVDDPDLAPRLKRAPAAMTMHHAYLGGLLEHIVSLAGLAVAVSVHYPELDPDLLLAGVVLHDIGKLDELRYVRSIDYSDHGRLLGHIMIGARLVREKCNQIPGFPTPLAVLVEHLIVSHHGTHEFGSPSLPQIPEAVMLHFLDEVDSKMAGMRATLEAASADRGPGNWTGRNPSLRRALLRADKFLGENVPSNGTGQGTRSPATEVRKE